MLYSKQYKYCIFELDRDFLIFETLGCSQNDVDLPMFFSSFAEYNKDCVTILNDIDEPQPVSRIALFNFERPKYMGEFGSNFEQPTEQMSKKVEAFENFKEELKAERVLVFHIDEISVDDIGNLAEIESDDDNDDDADNGDIDGDFDEIDK